MQLKQSGRFWLFSVLSFACLATAMTAGSAVLGTKSACAAGPYPALPVCDPAFYDTLQKKAWAETTREIQVNNTVITKPASVLGLSCFDGQINQMYAGSTIFTGTGQNGRDFNNDMNEMMGSSLSDYMDANFEDPPITSNVKFQSGSGSTAGCNRLNQIWEDMKCSATDPNTSFTLLQSLDSFRAGAASGTDVRALSGGTNGPNCSSAASALNTNYESGMQASSDLQAAGGGNANYFSVARPDFCVYAPKTGSALGSGQICASTGSAKSCSQMPAIPTGLVVPGSSGSDKLWSYACLNPGCYFDEKANAGSIKYSAGGTPPTNLTCSDKPSS